MTALVTGASAGIGRAFAKGLAARGHDLVLVARDAGRLGALSEQLHGSYGVSAESLGADLLAADGLARVEARLRDADSPVDLLVNNAGFGTYGRFADLDVDRDVEEVGLNVLAVMRLTHAAVGAMAARGTGVVMNISSLAAYQPTPNSATYGATKAFVNSFTQAVCEEQRESGVHVMLVCPGFTHTEFHARAGVEPPGLPELLWQTPEEVVTAALRDLDRRRAVSIPGALNRAAVASARIVPTLVTRKVAAEIIGRLRRDRSVGS